MAKFFFFIQKLTMISCQCRVVAVYWPCVRVIDARAPGRKRASQAGLQELPHVKIFASSLTEKPLSRSPTIILSWLFFRPPNYPSTRPRFFFALFPRELYASRKFSRRKIQEKRDKYPWFLFLRFNKYFDFNIIFFDYLNTKLRTMNQWFE